MCHYTSVMHQPQGHYYKHTMKIRKINISNRQSIAIVAEIAKVV